MGIQNRELEKEEGEIFFRNNRLLEGTIRWLEKKRISPEYEGERGVWHGRRRMHDAKLPMEKKLLSLVVGPSLLF